MEEKELLEAREAILKAISEKDYEISIDEPNNLDVRQHADGTEYIVVSSRDDAKSSTYFGESTLYVAGHEFTCNLEYGEWRSDVEELLEDEEVMEAIEGIEGLPWGEMTDMDSQVDVYNMANGTAIDEYYWCEDDECPMDPDSMNSLDDFGWTSYEYDGETYYLVDDEINEEDDEYEGKRWGYGAYGDPDDYGKFTCVILFFGDEAESLDGETVTGTMETDTMIDNDGCIE